MATAKTLTEAEIGNKVAAVAAGHKMAGFNVTDADREAGRAIIAGSIVTDTWTDTDSGQNRYKQVVLADAVGKSL